MSKRVDMGVDYFPLSHKVVVLSLVTEDNEGEHETMFGVAWDFAKQLWGIESESEFEDFLYNEYTSDDSQLVFDEAQLQNKLVFWKHKY